VGQMRSGPIAYAAVQRGILCLVVLALVAVLVGCPQSSGEQPIHVIVTDDSPNGGAQDGDVVELAKREGELCWYTSLPQEAAQHFLDLFREKHPYLTTQLVRGSTFDTIQTIQSEIDNGKVRADVLHVLDVAIFTKWRKHGNLLRYSSPEERFIPAKYKAPGYWSALRIVGLCVAYDSARLQRDQVPSTWPELLSERWLGRAALKDAQTAGSAYAHYYFLRDQYGSSYWHRMARQRPRIYKTANEAMEALSNGEVDLFSGAMGYSISERESDGSTIRAVWPTDGVPMMLGPIAILRGAPHRNAAKLFLDFALSKEGQEALRDTAGAYSVRKDVDPPQDRPSLSALKIMTPMGGWEAYAQSQETLKSEYTDLFHPGSE